MMKILLVDDDQLIRNWLKLFLEQLADQYVFDIEEASDGMEAVELLERFDADLLITDIKMPRMDGMELVRYLKEHKPNTRSCVLSSYDEFDYVKVALRAGALDYILKAEMRLEDISSLLSKVEADLKNGTEVEIEKDMLIKIKKHEELFQEMKKQPTSYENSAFLSLFSTNLTTGNLHICSFTTTRFNPDSRFETCAYIKTVLHTMGRHSIVFPVEDQFLLLYCSDTHIPEMQREEFIKTVTILSQNLQKYLNIKIGTIVDTMLKDSDVLYLKVVESIDLLKCKAYYLWENFPINSEGFDSFKRSSAIMQLQKLIDNGSYQEAVTSLESHLKNIHDVHTHPKKVQAFLSTSLSLFITSELVIKSDDAKIVEQLDELLRNVLNAKTAEGAQGSLHQFMQMFFSLCQDKQLDLSPPIKNALQYINAHYQTKLTLEDVSSHVYLNSSYLSQLFKKEMGIAFGEYLENMRIRYAKNLIKSTHLSMNEISEKVGFSSQNYFTRVFKKVTGLSPARYKEKH
ncbi:response regulator transcription factor [Proteiniclasticum ruminis]|uniref:Stage 0 sporulation protein A homolog n=1 Tax=Proteiniclasticum ruminis TaxID=398199 RepID=A0A1G8JTB0_9CLOT|nr:response regulator [Proteiniclasticum ruminis]SDI34469.1 Two-component response regulator, YesN/AraC family, consists of REC and AraC-type DNA-binding domains [Proteiniclasticum ruminis]